MKTFASVPGYQAQERPDEVGLRFGDRTTTFAQFELSTNQIANALVRDGLGPGTPVAYLGKNSDRWAHVLFGVAKAGAILVSINWRLAPSEVSFILGDSASRVLFVAPEYLPIVEAIRPDLPLLTKVILLDGDREAEAAFEAWCRDSATADPAIEVHPDDALCLQYTSGTTGRPKGAQLSHRNFIESLGMAAAASDFLSLGPGEAHLINLPQFHVSGPVMGYAALSQGAEYLVVEDFKPSETLDLVTKRPIKTLTLVPTMVQMLLDEPDVATADFSRLEYVSYGAAPMPPALLRRAVEVMGCKFVQVYGLTENSGMTTLLPPEDHDPRGNERMLSVGRPLPGVELAVVDDKGHPLANGAVGEICVRSPGVMQGYWNLPDATADTIQDGWLRTGDAGFLDDDGYVYLKDRIKDVIISGGENIYPAEVEKVLHTPPFEDVAVIGVPDDRWGEVPKAVVVVRPGEELDAGSLIEWAAEHLARYKLPKSIEIVDLLPGTQPAKSSGMSCASVIADRGP